MQFYPAELVTPPLALVALLGCPRLHTGVGEFLRSQQKPPINSLGVADPWSAARLFGERKANLTAPSDRTGILKVGNSVGGFGGGGAFVSLYRHPQAGGLSGGVTTGCLRLSVLASSSWGCFVWES